MHYFAFYALLILCVFYKNFTFINYIKALYAILVNINRSFYCIFTYLTNIFLYSALYCTIFVHYYQRKTAQRKSCISECFFRHFVHKKEDPDYPVPDLLQAFPPLCKQNGQACVNSPPPQRRDDFLRITSPKTITFS